MAQFDKENGKIVIDGNDFVTLTRMRHISEIQYLEKQNNRATIKKVSKESFVILSTGELREFKKTENRAENFSSLRKTFKKIRYLINNNFTGQRNELFATLTYKENMQDTTQLYIDFKKFMGRMRYTFKEFGRVEYLDIIEPQKRGAWHHHVLLKFPDQEKVFIENALLSELWGHGFVRVNRVQNVDNIGAYLTAYLADIPLEEVAGEIIQGEIVEKETDRGKKKFVKGGRLHLYPTSTNLYRKSKGILFPDRKIMTYEQAKKLIGLENPVMESCVFLEVDDYENRLKFEQYNSKRKEE